MPAPGAAHDELSLDRTVDRQTDAATNARVLYLRLRYEEVSRGVNKRLTCCTQSAVTGDGVHVRYVVWVWRPLAHLCHRARSGGRTGL